MKTFIGIVVIASLLSFNLSAQNRNDTTLTPHQRDSIYRLPYNRSDNPDKLYPNQRNNDPLQRDDRDPKKNPDMMRDSTIPKPRNNR